MRWGQGWSAFSASAKIFLLLPLVALALGGCNTTGPQSLALSGAQGATVAFDSIDGAPRDVFDRLVQELNVEARSRNLAVVSRSGGAAYRVRGYLVAEDSAKQGTISWVWDVYDGRQQRVLRITGEQAITGKQQDTWKALDGPVVQKIAHDSIAQLAAFLTSPDATPAQVAYGDGSSPEAAGILRVLSISAAPADVAPQEIPAQADVPMPPHRPGLAHTAALTVVATGHD